MLSGPPPVQKQEEGFELIGARGWANARRLQRSTQGAKAPQRSRREVPGTSLLRQFVCVPVVLKVFDGAIVFKPHIVKVSLAGHGVGRADGVRSCGLDGYLAVGR